MNKQTHLTNKELETSFFQAVRNERKIMHVVIVHVQEISRRKFYLEKGFGSLYTYLTQAAKYSSSAAQRRIEAAKLLNEVPEVEEKLKSGDINLSQIGELQRGVKEAEKIHQEKVTLELKSELLNHLSGKNTSQTQQLISEALDIPVSDAQKIKTQKDESKRVEVTFSKEQYAKFEKLRDLFAHKNFQAKRTQNVNDVLETLFDELLSKQLKEESASSRGDRAKLNMKDGSYSSAGSMTSHNIVTEVKTDGRAQTWNSLTPKRKREILAEDQCCQFVDYETGRVCGSTFNLHVDHIIPKHAGGKNDPGNLRILCREHNLYRLRAVPLERELH